MVPPRLVARILAGEDCAVESLGSGRASQVFDLGDGRVLRRGGSPEREALVMGHARSHGFPVPQVFEVLDDGLVMERIDGPTMWDELRRRPWRSRGHAHRLAELHVQLNGIEAPPSLEAAGEGDRLLHLDLHPDNVLVSDAGPIVIDWTNARRGDPALDVAMTWVIAATSGGALGRRFVRPFLSGFDRDAIERALPLAAERRIADPAVTDRERAAVRRMLG